VALILPIHTSRLTLRDFVPGDFDAIHSYASDPDVTRFMFHGVRTVEDTRAYLNRMIASQTEEPRLIWELAVVVTSVGRLIGACDLTCENEREGDLGFIFAKDVWGMGFATEAVRTMVRAGFEQLGLSRIFSTCDVANAASARVLEKAGLQRVATLDRHHYALGRWWTSHLYEVHAP
jgi:[ribosomal protein S5]-alanine N-acetyltransferase